MTSSPVEPPDDLGFNPLYAGVGRWPHLIDDDEWIRLALEQINNLGARPFLQRMLEELRETLGDDSDEDAALSDEELLDRVQRHLDKKEVTQCLRLGEAPGALLVFSDGHALPVMPPDSSLLRPEALDDVVGKHLVMAEVVDAAEEAGGKYLALYFHPDPEAMDEVVEGANDEDLAQHAIDEAIENDPELLSLDTIWESGTAILCPSEHRAELGPDEEDDFDAEWAADRIDAHVLGLRVADRVKIPAGGPEALVFDDGHVLPVEPPPGLAAQLPDLEVFIGKFLVWVSIGDDEPIGSFLELVFSDDDEAAARLEALDDAAADEEFERLLDEARRHPTAARLAVGIESARELFCPAEHDDESDDDEEDDEDEDLL